MHTDRLGLDRLGGREAEATVDGQRRKGRVPGRALVISVLALAVPAVSTLFFFRYEVNEVGMLVWLTALVPAFLLAYHRSWWGVTLALAVGMAVLSVTHALLLYLDLGMPPWEHVLTGILIYLAVCLGVGTMAELLHRERNRAAELALTDVLTGLPNRRHANLFLESTFAAAERGHPMTVVMFDLDRFKRYNDRYGHPAGDHVLEEFGAILGQLTRRMNLTARYGGEEFIAILANSRLEGAEIFVGRILDALRATRFPGGQVTVSAGIAEYEPGMETPEELVAAADRALYECKEEGGDGYRTVPRTVRGPELLEERSDEAAGSSSEERAEVEATAPSLTGRGAMAADPVPLPQGSESVLLVEGDPDTRRAVGALLERLGYRVLESSRGEEALSWVEALDEAPDLLITDLGLEDMNGFALAERLLERLGELRVVYISGRARGEHLWPEAPGTVRNFVTKPFDAADLAQRVRGTLEGEGAAPANGMAASGSA